MARKATPPMDTEVRAELPILSFGTALLFEQWLVKQPVGSNGLWLKLAKQGSGVASVTKQQAIEVALCHGWIDGQLKPYDDKFWLIRFTPRSAKSRWSEINRTTMVRLIAEGRASPAGVARVEAAQRDGRWELAYAPQSRATVPPDLQSALDANPIANEFFATLSGANRYAILYRVQDARTSQTRQRRIETFVDMLARQEVLHPTRPNAKSKAALVGVTTPQAPQTSSRPRKPRAA